MTESLFPGGGYNTPPTSVPFLSNSPLELVSKNFPSGTVTFSQVKSDIYELEKGKKINTVFFIAIGQQYIRSVSN